VALNRALLAEYYGVEKWDIPEGFLCPPIPGRADYIHLVSDLIEESKPEAARGPAVRGLDIGVGANCVFPIIGVHEYGWSFTGADINPRSIESARAILDANPVLSERVELRLQKNEKNIFSGIIKSDERFDFTLCNPPFHASMEEAQAGSRRKWKNLGKPVGKRHEKQVVNFGGQGAELWCEGGEITFLNRMIEESVTYRTQCGWFTTLVSRSETLPKLFSTLKRVHAKEWKTLDMAQGQKKSRILAWRF